MEDDDDWVMVGRRREKDLWNPSNFIEGMFETDKALKVRFKKPAEYWTDALPIGNGRLAAMVWGGVLSETINLNEDTLWTGNPGTYTDSDAPEVVSEVRRLVDAGKYAEATTAAAPLLGKPTEVDYEAKGWVAHQVSDIWAKTSPDRGKVVWSLWPMGGAWLCTHLWEHYTFTMDKDFLEKVYSLLEGCVSFLLDWLIEGRGTYLETNPSTSPEHPFIAPDGQPASVNYSTTMDMAIISEVFSAFVSAAKILGKSEDDLVEKVLKAQPRLSPTKIARDGSIMEWERRVRGGQLCGKLLCGHAFITASMHIECFPAAVSEMLVQSTVQDVHLLPALPRDKWPNGYVRGLKARGGLTVNIYWGEGDLREVGLWTNHSNCTTRLHYRGTTVTTKLLHSRVYTFNKQLKCIKTYAL